MNRENFILVLSLFFFLAPPAFIGCGCGDDDSEDDDLTDDDDTDVDDDNGPVDDDLDDDTDDGPDDDMDDDDTGTPNREPLAVLDCSPVCAAVDEEVSFSAEDTVDPEDGALNFVYDFGDGHNASDVTAAHAYEAPGAYRVTLTVTDDNGWVDTSSCIVSVGDFPVGMGTMDVLDLMPNHYDPAIIETQPKPDHGGVLWGFFDAASDGIPDTILLNGEPADPESGNVRWCEIVQESLLAGDLGILRCQTNDADFNPGKTVEVEVKAGSTLLWSKTETLPQPSLQPSYITPSTDGMELLVHVRNDGTEVTAVTGLSIDGIDVSDFIVVDNETIGPGEVAVIRVLRCDGIPPGDWTVFTVVGETAKGAVSASRALRLFEPKFLIGNWNGSGGDVFTDVERRQEQMDLGINLFLWYPQPAFPPETILPLAEANDFYLWTHTGGFNPGDYFATTVENYGDDPRWFSNATCGECDGQSWESGVEALDEVRAHRSLWPEPKPQWLYFSCSYYHSVFAPIGDVGGMDHYGVLAPKCNINWPPFYWDAVELTGAYARVLKRTNEPKPAWNWTQSSKTDFEIFGRHLRCTTADEIRAQWYEVLAAGTKTMFWFFYRDEQIEECPEESTDIAPVLAAELEPLKDILLDGDVPAEGTIVSTEDELLHVTATVAPHGIAIFVVNIDYTLNLVEPWTWTERTDVVLNFTPPAGFEPMTFYWIENDQWTELTAANAELNTWAVFLPPFSVAQPILVVPEP